MAEVLDRYGNNFAVRCPACEGVFVVSSHINAKSGRVCPHCERGKARIENDEVYLELVKQNQKHGLESVATISFVEELGARLEKDILLRANNSKTYGPWTEAVYDSLKAVAVEEGWEIYPQVRKFLGEYLCDFMLIQSNYGCRVACESQWQHSSRKYRGDLDWAFDKLRGVKSDVKLFIFEGTKEQWEGIANLYLTDNAQISKGEAFLALRWEGSTVFKSWWIPQHDGVQTGPIKFHHF